MSCGGARNGNEVSDALAAQRQDAVDRPRDGSDMVVPDGHGGFKKWHDVPFRRRVDIANLTGIDPVTGRYCEDD